MFVKQTFLVKKVLSTFRYILSIALIKSNFQTLFDHSLMKDVNALAPQTTIIQVITKNRKYNQHNGRRNKTSNKNKDGKTIEQENKAECWIIRSFNVKKRNCSRQEI